MSTRITIHPDICHGKPVIRGLRYPVENVLQWLASGMSASDIAADYPDLEPSDILACLAYAARLVSTHRFEPFEVLPLPIASAKD